MCLTIAKIFLLKNKKMANKITNVKNAELVNGFARPFQIFINKPN